MNVKPLALTAALATALGAGPPRKDADPQARYEPSGSPGVGQAYLEGFVGDWDVVKTFYPREGRPVRAEGTCRQAMAHGGRFLRSEFVFRQAGGGTSTGTGLIGFEPDSGAFTSVWADSRQTRMSFRRSRGPFDGKAVVLYSGSLEGEAGEARRSKTLTRLEDGGRKVVHRQYALGPDGSERLMMDLVMTRKSGPPARP